MGKILRAVLILTFCAVATCCAAADPVLHAGTIGRTGEEQWAASVLVASSCDGVPHAWGSGTLISGDRVLTALHVASCPAGQTVSMSVTVDADPLEADVEVTMPEQDIARLRLKVDVSRWFTPIVVGTAPPIGERVCWAAPAPRRTYRCGTSEGLFQGDLLLIDGFTEHGNSGAALYDSRGRLVGVILATVTCQTGVYCTGIARVVHGLEFLVP